MGVALAGSGRALGGTEAARSLGIIFLSPDIVFLSLNIIFLALDIIILSLDIIFLTLDIIFIALNIIFKLDKNEVKRWKWNWRCAVPEYYDYKITRESKKVKMKV